MIDLMDPGAPKLMSVPPGADLAASLARALLALRDRHGPLALARTEVLASVNDYFGFTAVSKLKLVQKPLNNVQRRNPNRTPRGELAQAKAEKLDAMVENIDNDQIKQALKKLGKGVFSEGSSE